MSAAATERLVYMANQIAAFFVTQPGGDAPLRIADHLTSFWEPGMRRAIIDHLDTGGEGLNPAAADAVRILRSSSARGVERMVVDAGQSSPGHRPGDDAG